MAAFVSGVGVGRRVGKGCSSSRNGRRVLVSGEDGKVDNSGEGDSGVQDALERALRQSIKDMKEKGDYGEKETDEIRRIGEKEIRLLADALKEDLEQYRENKRENVLKSGEMQKLEKLMEKFDQQAEELEEMMDREQQKVIDEAEQIRKLSEEYAALKNSPRSSFSPRQAVLFFLSWGFGSGSIYYVWRGIDSGYLADGLVNAGFDAAVAAVCIYLYLKDKATQSQSPGTKQEE
mmetsp:Transcript_36705/g.146781  ORF Transcript_36705/g.146781 Transcript_36705/m.146781 type:complete len:234 (-) Transcript_36705:620-1321(-)